MEWYVALAFLLTMVLGWLVGGFLYGVLITKTRAAEETEPEAR